MPVRVMQTSFNGGELSRRMEGRVDTAIYAIGVAEMLNFCPTVEGPTIKRSGSRYVDQARAGATWLERFEFNATQSYVLEFSEGRIRFYTNDVRLEDGNGAPIEIGTSYSSAHAPDLSIQQSGDVLYMAHRSQSPKNLLRTGAATFGFGQTALMRGPYKDANSDQTATVRASGVIGTVTLNASLPIFVPGHVGGLFRMEALDFSTVAAWEPGIKTAIGDVRRSDGKVYDAVGLPVSGGRTGSVQPVHDAGTETDGMGSGVDVNDKAAGGVRWRYLFDRLGELRITQFVSATEVRAEVTRTLPGTVTTVPTWRWAHGAFSDAEGWPSHVALWNERLIYATDFEVFASVVGDYRNFAERDSGGRLQPDLAWRRRLSSSNPIVWLKADRQLLLGTSRAEYSIAAADNGSAGGANLVASTQGFYGSQAVEPLQVGTRTIFVQRGGRKLREAGYEFGQDRYVATNMTVWARHITRSGVRQLFYLQETEELIGALLGDGTIALRSYSPEQDVKGFGRLVLGGGGRILSAVSCPSPDGGSDDLWMLVERGGVRMVERLEDWWEEGNAVADAFFVDSGLSYAGAPVSNLSGLGHLANQAVWVLADGIVVAGQTVSPTGTLTLPFAAAKVHVGLPYTARITSMRPEPPAQRGGVAQGARKRVVKLVARLIDALGLWGGTPDAPLDPLMLRKTNAPMNEATPLVNDDTDNVTIGGGWNRGGQYIIESRQPLPAIIVATLPTLEVGD